MSRQPNGISVVIPTFNRRTTIEQAINSVLAQTQAPAEVVVVDDGSNDGTAEVLSGYGDRITVVHQANGGVCRARNAGVDAVRTPWVAFLDSDDLWDPSHLGALSQAIGATDGRAHIYFTDTVRRADGRDVGQWEQAGFAIDASHRLVEDGTAWLLSPRHPMAIQATVVRRARYVDVGGCWPDLVTREDTHLLFRIGLTQPLCAVAAKTAVVSDEVPLAQRETGRFPPASLTYLRSTALLYEDVLGRSSGLDRAARRELAVRGARARIRLAKRAASEGRYFSASQDLLRATRLLPTSVSANLGRGGRSPT